MAHPANRMKEMRTFLSSDEDIINYPSDVERNGAVGIRKLILPYLRASQSWKSESSSKDRTKRAWKTSLPTVRSLFSANSFPSKQKFTVKEEHNEGNRQAVEEMYDMDSFRDANVVDIGCFNKSSLSMSSNPLSCIVSPFRSPKPHIATDETLVSSSDATLMLSNVRNRKKPDKQEAKPLNLVENDPLASYALRVKEITNKLSASDSNMKDWNKNAISLDGIDFLSLYSAGGPQKDVQDSLKNHGVLNGVKRTEGSRTLVMEGFNAERWCARIPRKNSTAEKSVEEKAPVSPMMEMAEIVQDTQLISLSKTCITSKLKNHLENRRLDEAYILLVEYLTILRGKKGARDKTTFREDNRNADVGSLLFNIGNLKLLAEKYDGAKRFYFNALQARKRKCRDKPDHDIIVYLVKLGITLLALSEFRDAQTCLFQALDMALLIDANVMVLSKILNNIGCCYYYMKKHDAAITFIKLSLSLYECVLKEIDGSPHILSHSLALCNLGVVYMEEDSHDDAEVALKHALMLQGQILEGNHRTMLNTIDCLSTSYLKSNNMLC